jgi:hypothetical protein
MSLAGEKKLFFLRGLAFSLDPQEKASRRRG